MPTSPLRRSMTLILIAGGLCASEAEDAFRAGAAALGEEDWERAEEHFSTARQTWGDHPDILALLGIAHARQGEYHEAIVVLGQAVEGETRYLPRALYELGISHSALGNDRAAQSCFQRLAEDHPGSPEAKRLAERTGRKLPTIPLAEARRRTVELGEKDWRCLGHLGLYYDSTPAQRSGGADEDVLARAIAWGRLPLGSPSLMLEGGIQYKKYLNTNDFDTGNIHAGIEGDLSLSVGSISPAYDLDLTWVGGDFFQARNQMEVEWEYHCLEDCLLELTPYLAYRWHASDYDGLDGYEYGAESRMTWQVDWQPLDHVTAGLLIDRYHADNGYAGWSEGAFDCAARWRLPWSARLDSEVAYRIRDYEGKDPGRQRKRDDTRLSCSLHYRQLLGKRWLGTVSIAWRDYSSNIDLYDYDQFFIGAGIGFVY